MNAKTLLLALCFPLVLVHDGSSQEAGSLFYSTRIANNSLSVHVYPPGCFTVAMPLWGNTPEEYPAGWTDYGARQPVSGSQYKAELWASVSGDPRTLSLVPNSRVVFRADGYIQPIPKLAIPFARPGQRVFLQLRAWGSFASTYQEAVSSDAPIGYSKVFRSLPLGGFGPDGLFLTPGLQGLESFSLFLAGDVPFPVVFDNAPGAEGGGSTGRVYELDGTTPLSGDRYLASCFVGSAAVPESRWLPLDIEPTPFLEGDLAGFWQRRVGRINSFSPAQLWRVEPSTADCSTAGLLLQARAWRVEDGKTFEEARAKSGVYGVSTVIDAPRVPFPPIPPLIWPSFRLESHPVLRLASVSYSEEAGTKMVLSGGAGLKYLVQSSANLIRWTPETTGTFSTDTVSVSLPSSGGGQPVRFYRAEILE